MAVAPDVGAPDRAARTTSTRLDDAGGPGPGGAAGPDHPQPRRVARASWSGPGERFPDLWMPNRSDLCFATTNRQAALKAMAGEADAVVVIGSANSSNTVALEKVARAVGLPPGGPGQRRRRAARRPHGHRRGHRRGLGARGAGAARWSTRWPRATG